MTREDAIERIKSPELDDHFVKKEFEYVSHKLGLTVNELKSIFESDNKNVGNYRNKQLLVNFGSKMMQLFGLEKRLYK
jgi:putative aminotransferase